MRMLLLTGEQWDELDQLARREPKAYLRERAAALLKIASGEIPAHVARNGLLLPRDPDTIYSWLDRYQAEGVAGLRIRPGRGRKPAFSPCGGTVRGGEGGYATSGAA